MLKINFKMTVSALLCGLLLSLSGGLLAQTVTISGNVFENDETSPVEAATVLIKSSGAGTYTNDKGAYTIKTPLEPIIEVTFQYFGQTDTTLQVITEEGIKEYNLNLTFAETGISMGVQVITAGRHAQDLEDVVSSMDVIEPSKIDIQATNNIEDALQQGSGVDIIDGQPNIRGSSGYAYGVGSRVMVMLDGLPLLSPDAAFAQFDLIPTDNIAQIEIMKGASSVLYGSSALGGVINVITADAPYEPLTSIRVRGQIFDAPKNPMLDWDGPNSSPMTGGISTFHSRRVRNHGITLLADVWRETGYRAPETSTQGRFIAMTRFRPKAIPGLTWGVNGSYRFDSSSTFLFWDSYLPGDSIPVFGSDSTFSSQGAFTGYRSRRNQLNQRWTIDPFIKYLDKREDVHYFRARVMRTNNTNDTDQNNRNWLWYNDYQYTKQLFDDRVTWVTGATGIYNRSDSSDLYGPANTSINLAAYSQLDVIMTPKLNITLGARYDYININDTINIAAPIFRAGANYEIVKGTNIRGSFGQAFRSPSIAERYTATNASGLIIEPNPDIEVERGYSAELGIRQGLKFGDDKRYLIGFVDVAAFLMSFDNMVEFGVKPPETFVFGSPVFQARNVQDARITGVEATSLLEVGINDFFFSVNGGVTRINPVNLNAAPDSMQVDLFNTLGPQDDPQWRDDPDRNQALTEMFLSYILPEDNPARRVDNPEFLKYRSEWLNRFSATAGYGRYAFTTNFRHRSEIKNIDQFLYIAIPGSADFVRQNPGGFAVWDFIFAVDVLEDLKISAHLENAFNKEYVALPGIIQEPRNFTIQVKYQF